MKYVYEVRLCPAPNNTDVKSRKVTILYTTAPFEDSDKSAYEYAEGDATARGIECMLKFCEAEGYHLGKHWSLCDSEGVRRFNCWVEPKRYPY